MFPPSCQHGGECAGHARLCGLGLLQASKERTCLLSLHSGSVGTAGACGSDPGCVAGGSARGADGGRSRCSPLSSALVLSSQDSLPHGAILGDSADLSFQSPSQTQQFRRASHRVRATSEVLIRRILLLRYSFRAPYFRKRRYRKAERGEDFALEACSMCTATPRLRPKFRTLSFRGFKVPVQGFLHFDLDCVRGLKP